MSSVGVFARNLSRRTFTKVQLPNSTTRNIGATRMKSYFTPAHEYVSVDGNIATCGITDFAQAELGDIVFVDLPAEGDDFDMNDAFGSVESVKAASDVYAPVSGTVVQINEKLQDEPGLVNSHAETDAWFIKLEMSDESQLEGLMDADAYKEHCDK